MKEYKKRKPIIKYIFYFSCTACVISLIFQMYATNVTALKGKDFREYYDKKEHLERDIALLKYEESNLMTLSYIEDRATHLGFIPMNSPVIPIASPSLASLYSR